VTAGVFFELDRRWKSPLQRFLERFSGALGETPSSGAKKCAIVGLVSASLDVPAPPGRRESFCETMRATISRTSSSFEGVALERRLPAAPTVPDTGC
jgi:hypothetical protein